MKSFPDRMADADISFSYGDGARIFSSFRFSVPDRGGLLVIAPPGSGKTTLARIITGAVPAYSGGSLSGYVSVSGCDILALPAPMRMEKAGRVSQNSDEMMLFSSAEEEISFPLANLGLPAEEIRKRVSEAMDLFGLEMLRGVPASELSGGEKRRLMLAVLFAVDPELYILDESFDELSPLWRKKLVSLLRSRCRSFIVLGSHYLAEYDEIGCPVISIEDGHAVPFRKEEIPVLDFPDEIGSSCLSASSLTLMRRHRSSAGSGFTLSVPSFSIREGECAVLTGDNGAGKSSFSRVLCGLLQEIEGSVLLDGRMLTQKERKKTVAYLMQNPYEELFLPTVLDEARSTGASSEEIDAALDLFGLDPGWYIAEISYGRAKLVQAMVFYLLKRPFAIFDEFDSSLPYEKSLEAVRIYLERGCGVLVITHDNAFASALPGRKLGIEGGVLHEY